MAIQNFIPQVWSARLLAQLDKSLVYAQAGVVNRDYEGEIKDMGDSVKINSIGDVTVSTYVKNADLAAAEELQTSQQVMVIDQGKYFNFQVDDVEAAQARPKVMEEAMRRAAHSLKDKVDQYVATLMRDAAPAANTIGTAGAPKTDLGTAGKAYEYLVDLGVYLDEANVPSDGRWAILPSWYHGLLLKDARFVSAGTAATDQTLKNGKVGEAAGFTIMKSNNVPVASTTYRILVGHQMAGSYADQVIKTEAYRPEKRFADGVKGLQVFGAKVVRPSAVAQLICNRA